MKFTEAIDQYIADQRQAGRINSPRTKVAYRRRFVSPKDAVNFVVAGALIFIGFTVLAGLVWLCVRAWEAML